MGSKEEKKPIGKCGCPRALPWAPRVWAPEGACAFEIPSSSLSQFIFCTNIKRDWGPPGPSNYHPSPSSPQTTRRCSRKPCPLPRARPSREQEVPYLAIGLEPQGLGTRLMAFPWDRRQGTRARGPGLSHRGGVLPSSLLRPRRPCRRGRKEGMWLFPSPRPRAWPPEGAGHRPFRIPPWEAKLNQGRRRTQPSERSLQTCPQESPSTQARPAPLRTRAAARPRAPSTMQAWHYPPQRSACPT